MQKHGGHAKTVRAVILCSDIRETPPWHYLREGNGKKTVLGKESDMHGKVAAVILQF